MQEATAKYVTGLAVAVVIIIILVVVYTSSNNAEPSEKLLPTWYGVTSEHMLPVLYPTESKNLMIDITKEHMFPTYNPAKEKKLLKKISSWEQLAPAKLSYLENSFLRDLTSKEHMFPTYNPAKEKKLLNELNKEYMFPTYNPAKEKKLLNELNKEYMRSDMLYVEKIYNTLANPVKEHLENGVPLHSPKRDVALLRSLTY